MNIRKVLENDTQGFTRDEMADIIESMGLTQLSGVTIEQLRSIPVNDYHDDDLSEHFHIRLHIILSAYIVKHGID